MHRMFEWYDTHGLSGNPLVLRRVLGHESRTLLSFLEEGWPDKRGLTLRTKDRR